jgi:hypothetical protein
LESTQISPALSVGSNSSRKGKVGITIKKSPNSDRTFETSLLGGDDSDEEEEEAEISEDSDDEGEYESFKAEIRKEMEAARKERKRRPSSTKDPGWDLRQIGAFYFHFCVQSTSRRCFRHFSRPLDVRQCDTLIPN